MPLTPDHALELLFDPALIPQAAHSVVPADLHLRPLALTDYDRGHLHVLSVVSSSPDIGRAAYARRFHFQRSQPGTYYTIVIVDKNTDRIVATAALIVEHKFARGSGLAGHIEDVAVDKSQQGRKLGRAIVRAVIEIGDAHGCYKITGNCATHNIPFYEKLGFSLKEHEMARYAPAPGCKL